MIVSRSTFRQFGFLAAAVLCAVALQTFAFTEPNATPPLLDTSAPVNTGPLSQDKTGASGPSSWFTADGLGSRYGAVFSTVSGNLVVGTASTTVIQNTPAGYVSAAGYCVNGANCASSLGGGDSVPTIRTFTSSGTYTPTPGTKYIFVRIVGGGGGGDETSLATWNGGGGGAGEYAEGYFSAAQIGASQAISIGAGGAVGANGGATSLGTLLTAAGGGKGYGTNGGGGSNGYSAFDGGGGAGGSGGTGNGLHVPGGDGHDTEVMYVGGQYSIFGGSGGASYFGGGGAGGQGLAGVYDGHKGRAYGSGGGGQGYQVSVTGLNPNWSHGGAGAGGVVVIYEYQ